MEMPDMNWKGSNDYRYGYNGKEQDKDFANNYDYGFRIYNAGIGKFLSVDPLTGSYPWYTPYQFAGNKPIQAIDLDGLEEYYFNLKFDKETGKPILTLTKKVERASFLGIEYTPPLTAYINYQSDSYVNSGTYELNSIGFTSGAEYANGRNTIKEFGEWIKTDGKQESFESRFLSKTEEYILRFSSIIKRTQDEIERGQATTGKQPGKYGEKLKDKYEKFGYDKAVLNVKKQIPSDWTEEINTKGVVSYISPDKKNVVRVMPASEIPVHETDKVPYLRLTKNKTGVDVSGNPVDKNSKTTAGSHLPADSFDFNKVFGQQ
jgi:RHS repeat-associated protein